MSALLMPVLRKRLHELEAIERAHRDYMTAMRRMRVRAAETADTGYHRALTDFATMILEAGRAD